MALLRISAMYSARVARRRDFLPIFPPHGLSLPCPRMHSLLRTPRPIRTPEPGDSTTTFYQRAGCDAAFGEGNDAVLRKRWRTGTLHPQKARILRPAVLI